MAVTVAVAWAAINAGAVYRPAVDTVPAEADHVTPVFVVPVALPGSVGSGRARAGG